MLRRHVVIATSATLLSLPVFASGCSSDEKSTPQVIFDGTLEQTSEKLDPGEANCGESGPLFTIGDFGDPNQNKPSQPKKDGDAEQQGNVSVSCSVTSAANDTFNVSGSIHLSGATGGLFTLKPGTVNKTCNDQQPCGNLSAVFSKVGGAGITYTSAQDIPCTFRFTTPFQGVAPGRLWGEIECKKVVNANANVACKAIAQVRLENCDQ